MAHPLEILARQRIISASAELEAELSARSGSRPALEILRRLRKHAEKAVAALVLSNLFTREGREEAVTHQNTVKRYVTWFEEMRGLVSEGKNLDQEMREEEKDELFDYLTASPEGKREMFELGLIDEHPDT